MRRNLGSFSLALIFFLSTIAAHFGERSAHAADFNSDGLDDLYVVDTRDSTVTVFDLTGKELGTFELPAPIAATDDPPLFAGTRAGEPILFWLRVTGKQQSASATVISISGETTQFDVGAIKDATLFFYDADHDGSTDLILVGKDGATKLFLNPALSSAAPISVSIPRTKKGYPYSVADVDGDLHVVSFKRGGGKGKVAAELTPVLGGPSQTFSVKKDMKGLFLPIVSASKSIFLLGSKKRKLLLAAFDLAAGNINSQTTEASDLIAPGKYRAEGSQTQVMALQGDIVRVFDLASNATLAELRITSRSTPADDDSGGDDESHPDDARVELLLKQLEFAVRAGDVMKIPMLLQQIVSLNLSEAKRMDVMTRIPQILQGTSTGGNSGDFFNPPFPVRNLAPQTQALQTQDTSSIIVLGLPVYFAGSVSEQLGDPSGCTKTYDGHDGPSGFLWKPVSDSDGRPVVLFPAGISPSKVEITTTNGKKIAGTRSGGYGNGGRAHFRVNASPAAIPQTAIVRATLGPDAFLCYKILHSSQRSD